MKMKNYLSTRRSVRRKLQSNFKSFRVSALFSTVPFFMGVLLVFAGSANVTAEPVIRVVDTFRVGNYRPDDGLERKCKYLVENISPENIDDNNLIEFLLPAGLNQGVIYAKEDTGHWLIEIFENRTKFTGNGEYIGQGGDNTFYLYTPAEQPMGRGFAQALAVGDGTGHLDFNEVEVVVPVLSGSFFQPPTGLTNAVKTVAGAEHFVVLCSNGTVVAWGDNAQGQCNVPAGLSNAVDIAAGRYHSAALLADGSVVCWGRGAEGQTQVPSTVFGAKAIAAAESHTLAMMPGTDPTLPDTDFDGADDGIEVAVGTDPLDSAQRAMQLTATASASGTVSPTNQWVFPGTQLAVTAQPEIYWQVGEWGGNTNAIVSNAGNGVTLLMTNDVALSVVFVQIVTETNRVPHQWLADQGFDLEATDPETLAATDHDLDGYTTGEEYIFGTIPTNSASSFQVTIGDVQGFDFEFPTTTNRLYTVEYCGNLVSNVWNPLAIDLSGTGGNIIVSDTNAVPHRAYRVKVRMKVE